MNNLARPLFFLGVALVIAGVALLVVVGVTAFQVIDDPDSVGLVKFLQSRLGAGDRMLYGHVGNDTFEVAMTDPARTVILLFFGVLVFWVVAGIARAIISAGINMIRVMSVPAGDEAGPARTGNPMIRAE